MPKYRFNAHIFHADWYRHSLRIKQQQQPSKAEEKEEKDSKSMGIISSSVLHNTITYNI